MPRSLKDYFNDTANGRVTIYTSSASQMRITGSATWTSITVTSAHPTAPAADFSADPLWTAKAADRKLTAAQMKRRIEDAQSLTEILRRPVTRPQQALGAAAKTSAETPYMPAPNFPPARFLKY